MAVLIDILKIFNITTLIELEEVILNKFNKDYFKEDNFPEKFRKDFLECFTKLTNNDIFKDFNIDITFIEALLKNYLENIEKFAKLGNNLNFDLSSFLKNFPPIDLQVVNNTTSKKRLVSSIVPLLEMTSFKKEENFFQISGFLPLEKEKLDITIIYNSKKNVTEVTFYEIKNSQKYYIKNFEISGKLLEKHFYLNQGICKLVLIQKK